MNALTFFFRRIGRRTQFIGSGLLMAFATISLGTTMHLQDIVQGDLLRLVKLAQPFSVVLCSFAYGMGVGPVLFTMLGEIFPPRVKGFCASVSLAIR